MSDLEKMFEEMRGALEGAGSAVQKVVATLQAELFLHRVKGYAAQMQDGYEPMLWFMPQEVAKALCYNVADAHRASHPSNWEDTVVQVVAEALVAKEDEWFLMPEGQREIAQRLIQDGMDPVEALDTARVI